MRSFLITMLVIGLVLSLGGAAPAASATKRPAAVPAGEGGGSTQTDSDNGRPKPVDLRPMEKQEGLLTLYLDHSEGKVWLQVPADTGRSGLIGSYLYVEGLRTGLGSNPVGLDRGISGDTSVVDLRLVGSRLLVEEQNLGFRALTTSESERRATRESFATSVIWAGPIRDGLTGERLVDLTPFVVRDAHRSTTALADAGQGKFELDASRSVVDLDACRAFPENLELEAVLTFRGEEPGSLVAETAPSPDSITLVQHHSLVRLPDDGYRPRRFDPRAGSFAVGFRDYAVPLDQPVERRWIVRHRLAKTDPLAATSPVIEPIVYYVDPAIPEPVRGAVIEGAGWWAEAFAAAGFEDAFRVELLPAEADLLDIRYNVIEWVHRSTRGWSYGGGVTDPRTGEMVKGHVRLGSLRVRQDRLLFEGLAGTESTGSGAPDDPVELALARIRQLAAHEVGHTLGLTHNFAASTYSRASVMDYPAPLVVVDETGELDFSRAYDTGVGAWDIHGIRYAHEETPEGIDEEAFLDEIVQAGLDRGLLFITDQDARPPGAAHPLANLWDNGTDPAAQLVEEMKVRRLALDRFGEENIAPGRPLALLQEVLATVYFHHRYQLEAAVKLIGGLDYQYSVRGVGEQTVRPISGSAQRRALEIVLQTLAPVELDISEATLELLLPRPFGYGPNREMFGNRTAPGFDALGAAATAADMTIQGLLQPERAARLVDLHRRDSTLPGFSEVLAALTDRVFDTEAETPRLAEIQRVVSDVLVERLVALAADGSVAPEVRSRAEGGLVSIASRLAQRPSVVPAAQSHNQYLVRTIDRFLDRSERDERGGVAALPVPPGAPIGQGFVLDDRLGCSWAAP
jgi:hypothetical protein